MPLSDAGGAAGTPETPLTLLGSRTEIRYEPRGQVLVLAPWNYPFLLAIDPIVAAPAPW